MTFPCGYYFIATGDRYINELRQAVALLRKVTPLPIVAAVDRPCDFHLDHVIRIEDPSFSFWDKVNYIDRAPLDKAVYLDTDLSVFNSIDELFDLLPRVQIAASLEASLGLGAASGGTGVPDAFPELSTGLMAFHNGDPAVQAFLREWKLCYLDLRERLNIRADQPSFRRVLFDSPLRFSVIPNEFHLIPENFTRVNGTQLRAIHKHSFEVAAALYRDFSAFGGYRAFINGIGVVRNPYQMSVLEVLRFHARVSRVVAFVALWKCAIAAKQRLRPARARS